eukprot:512262-Rhodomonas_salina.1
MRSNSQETVGTRTTRRTFSPGSGCGAKTIWLSPTSDTRFVPASHSGTKKTPRAASTVSRSTRKYTHVSRFCVSSSKTL